MLRVDTLFCVKLYSSNKTALFLFRWFFFIPCYFPFFFIESIYPLSEFIVYISIKLIFPFPVLATRQEIITQTEACLQFDLCGP